MTTNQQFEFFWEYGCKHAILALVKNGGCPLTEDQINEQITNATQNGYLAQSDALARLNNRSLSNEELLCLIKACAKCERFGEALWLAEHSNVSKAELKHIIDLAVKARVATRKQLMARFNLT